MFEVQKILVLYRRAKTDLLYFCIFRVSFAIRAAKNSVYYVEKDQLTLYLDKTLDFTICLQYMRLISEYAK